MRRVSVFRALVVALPIAIAAATAAASAASYIVVLAAFDAQGGAATFDSAERMKTIAAGCGLEAWTEYTSKIKGFRPGYFAVILGPFQTRAEAEAKRRKVLACVPSAYVKAGVDLGE